LDCSSPLPGTDARVKSEQLWDRHLRVDGRSDFEVARHVGFALSWPGHFDPELYAWNGVEGRSLLGGVPTMRELEDEIALLELRAEQLLIHIQRLARGSAEAVVARANLDGIMQRLVAAKGERDHMLAEVDVLARTSASIEPQERTRHGVA
jgi:hypothetical protein